MSISPQGIPAPIAVPGPQLTWAEILEEYPELTEDVQALNGYRDTGQPDRRSKKFERQFPEMRPQT